MMPIQERARRYIATMPQSIEGSGGHTAIFNVALALRCGFDLSEDATLELLSEWNATHAQPPWNAADLRHKIQDAQHFCFDRTNHFIVLHLWAESTGADDSFESAFIVSKPTSAVIEH